MVPMGESRIELLEATSDDSVVAKIHRETRRRAASRGPARPRSDRCRK